MTHSEDPEENYLERAFWEFDAIRKKSGQERYEFKRFMRKFAAYHLDNYLRAQHGFEPGDEPKPIKAA